MIAIIYERGGGSPDIVTNTTICKITTGKIVFPTNISQYVYKIGSGVGASVIGVTLSLYGNEYILRSTYAYLGSSGREFVITILDGNFTYDNFEISSSSRRIEIRNENGVLLADNGLPWGDGTYPPDANNRAGLAGLQAAPVASANEFAYLSGLDPNKEVEIVESERGAGVQYALERDEDNGL